MASSTPKTPTTPTIPTSPGLPGLVDTDSTFEQMFRAFTSCPDKWAQHYNRLSEQLTTSELSRGRWPFVVSTFERAKLSPIPQRYFFARLAEEYLKGTPYRKALGRIVREIMGLDTGDFWDDPDREFLDGMDSQLVEMLELAATQDKRTASPTLDASHDMSTSKTAVLVKTKPSLALIFVNLRIPLRIKPICSAEIPGLSTSHHRASIRELSQKLTVELSDGLLYFQQHIENAGELAGRGIKLAEAMETKFTMADTLTRQSNHQVDEEVDAIYILAAEPQTTWWGGSRSRGLQIIDKRQLARLSRQKRDLLKVDKVHLNARVQFVSAKEILHKMWSTLDNMRRQVRVIKERTNVAKWDEEFDILQWKTLTALVEELPRMIEAFERVGERFFAEREIVEEVVREETERCIKSHESLACFEQAFGST